MLRLPRSTLFPYTTLFRSNSAGSAMAGLVQLADRFKKGETVEVIFHDHGTRYLGKMYNPDWMREKRSEEHTSELQSRLHHVCGLLLEKKNYKSCPRCVAGY